MSERDAAAQEEGMRAEETDLVSPLVMRPPAGGGRRGMRASFDPRRVSLAIAQNFDLATSGVPHFLEGSQVYMAFACCHHALLLSINAWALSAAPVMSQMAT